MSMDEVASVLRKLSVGRPEICISHVLKDMQLLIGTSKMLRDIWQVLQSSLAEEGRVWIKVIFKLRT